MNVHPGFSRGPAAETSCDLEIRGIAKNFGDVAALQSVSLAARPGELLAVTGPSGAGKTTLCRIIAGLETPDKGTCRIAGRDVTFVAPGRRHIAYMFESYALYPHMTVRANVMSPLLAPNGRGAGVAVVDELLALLEIPHLADRLPAQLSGGQKQRVALARVLVQHPTATLLDEPISHLDAKLRHKLRREIRRIVTARPSPTIWCTPDAMEALSIGDRIAVIEQGRIEQVATPDQIWRRPASLRVARLVGDPPMNPLHGHIEADGPARATFVSGPLRVALSPKLAAAAASLRQAPAVLGVRPDLISIVPAGAPATAAVEVYSHEPFGKYVIVTVRLGDALIKAKMREDIDAAIGAAAGLVLPAAGFALLDGSSGTLIESDGDGTDDADARSSAAPG